MKRLRLSVRVIRVGLILAAAAALGTLAVRASASQAFNGDVCALIGGKELAAAEVSEACVQKNGSGPMLSNYSAQWGANAGLAHYLGIMITKPNTNADFYYQVAKANFSKEGAPVDIGDWAYWKTVRYNGDRRRGDIKFKAGAYIVVVGLNDDNGAPDEVGIQQALFTIAKTIAAKLK